MTAKKIKAIDVHAHIFDEPMMEGIRKLAPDLGCKLTEVDDIQGRLHIGNIQQWPHPRGAWDMSVRLKDMDDNDVDMQVLSRYDRILQTRGENIVVGVTNITCGGCHMKLPQQVFLAAKAQKEIANCSNCGRILYYTRDMEG